MGSQGAVQLQDLFTLRGKTALVTGGSRGIGLMIAQGLLAAGAKVYVSSRKQEACDKAARELSAWGECVSLPGDVSSAAGCSSLAHALSQKEAKLHILVNNAGAAWGETLAKYPENGWDKVMATNVKSIFFLTRDLLPSLEKAATAADPARVINIGSIDGIKAPFYETYAYPASKAAVHHLTRHFATKFAGKNITVNAIAPGPFESHMTEWMLDHYRGQIEKACPLRRIGSPADMAGIAIYLASRAGAYVNGTVIPVDGGLSVA